PRGKPGFLFVLRLRKAADGAPGRRPAPHLGRIPRLGEPSVAAPRRRGQRRRRSIDRAAAPEARRGWAASLHVGVMDAPNTSPLEQVITGKSQHVAGFPVRRVLPTRRRRRVGPWTFLDHMGPAPITADRPMRVPPHPHLNLATVTYLFEGELVHRDSLG